MAGHQGSVKRVVSKQGIYSYEVDVWHDELGKHRKIKAPHFHLAAHGAITQLEEWAAIWQRKQDLLLDNASREEYKRIAAQQTRDAEEQQENIACILRDALSRRVAFEWEQLKDNSPFPVPPPVKPVIPRRPLYTVIPQKPSSSDEKFQPKLNLLDKFSASRREQKASDARSRYDIELQEWEKISRQAIDANAAVEKSYQQQLQILEQAYSNIMYQWEIRRNTFLRQQYELNVAVDTQKAKYLSGDPSSVAAYCEHVLAASEYPDFFCKEFELDYNGDTQVLAVDYTLPAPASLPTLVEVKYIATRNELSEKNCTAAQAEKLYEDLLYKVVLRTLHELFEADIVGALSAIILNGWVRSIDKATGNEVHACILSLQAHRAEFQAINLAQVDPKACFRQLKGVGSSKLHSITPVAPIMRLRRDDGRFVAARDVAGQLDQAFNLAAMDWEEFEHLIRELFEQEFSSTGGEVRVTQASRDGGVDAIAFDPDPIRGGKIVIQAKRYTNTVDVSAVRDLYGTVMNEGATKGILVTTSDYGPDAYAFARGKPLSLINGANLLHLLEKHGHQAKIDLNEARRIFLARSVKG